MGIVTLMSVKRGDGEVGEGVAQAMGYVPLTPLFP